MKDQLLRSARSTTALVAEGYGRFHFKETKQCCRSARGEAYEVLDHVITGWDEDLFPASVVAECRALVERAVMLLNGYVR